MPYYQVTVMRIVSILIFALLVISMLGSSNLIFASSSAANQNYFSLKNSIIDVRQITMVGVAPRSGTLSYSGNHLSTNSNFSEYKVTNTITVGKAPSDVAFSPSGAFAYVTNAVNNTVSVINTSTNTVVDNITVGSDPAYVVFSPSGAFAYVIKTDNNTVSVINTSTNTVVDNITLGSSNLGSYPVDVACWD